MSRSGSGALPVGSPMVVGAAPSPAPRRELRQPERAVAAVRGVRHGHFDASPCALLRHPPDVCSIFRGVSESDGSPRSSRLALWRSSATGPDSPTKLGTCGRRGVLRVSYQSTSASRSRDLDLGLKEPRRTGHAGEAIDARSITAGREVTRSRSREARAPRGSGPHWTPTDLLLVHAH
jgi:hypothetical protein